MKCVSRTVPSASVLSVRHVLDLDEFSLADIELVLDTASSMLEVLRRPIRRVPALRGKTMVNLFYEASTRTRVSFELAAKSLSADVVNVSASGSSVEKGESIGDTVKTLEALGADTIVIRHSASGAPYLAAEHTNATVINAGDGWHAHPTQALLDLYTLRQRFGRLAGLRVVIVGDILHSRVARSNIWGLSRVGASVTICAPHTLLPVGIGDGHCGGLPRLEVTSDLDRAIVDADAVMALRMQSERQASGMVPSLREYIRRYQITNDRLERARSNALVMHPGPMNEGVEIAPDVAHGARSVIQDQVTNGVAIRMALLYLLHGDANGTI
ncbi:MAG: aspartate carbamoyltransferase catalytic subunit [Chloroflexota bacterium]|nr:MAG: aspartate carbamoyltransferase catalytic subunit [Chloroflexota bacterium]